MYYLLVEDFVACCIGPFTTPHEAMEHYNMTKERGDGAAFISITLDKPDVSRKCSFDMTPEKDCERTETVHPALRPK